MGKEKSGACVYMHLLGPGAVGLTKYQVAKSSKSFISQDGDVLYVKIKCATFVNTH